MIKEKFEDNVGQYVSKSKYDARDKEFRQMHCLRFEIDKSKKARIVGSDQFEDNKDFGILKITDVDFHLDGNKHARLHDKN